MSVKVINIWLNLILYLKKFKYELLTRTYCGHKEGSKAFARYRDIDEEMKRELIGFLD